MMVFPMAAARTSAPSEALGGPLAFRVVVPGDDEAGAGGRHREGAEATGGEGDGRAKAHG